MIATAAETDADDDFGEYIIYKNSSQDIFL